MGRIYRKKGNKSNTTERYAGRCEALVNAESKLNIKKNKNQPLDHLSAPMPGYTTAWKSARWPYWKQFYQLTEI